MAISETTLKDTMLFLIDEQNKKGGLLGKKLEPVVVDPASDWPTFAEKARELISQDKVAAVFGCWTSSSRKSVLPVFKELNSILFYPGAVRGRRVRKERDLHRRRAEPAGDPGRRLSDERRGRQREALGARSAPTTSIRARPTRSSSNTSTIKGVAKEDIKINYTPFGFSDWQTEVAKIKAFGSAGKKTAVVSTINGDANVPFYKELANQGIKAEDIPVVAFSVGEEELARHGHRPTSSATSPPGTTSSPSIPRRTRRSSMAGTPTSRTTSASRTIRWKRPISASTSGSQAVPRPAPPTPTPCSRRSSASRCRTSPAAPRPCCPNHHLTKPVLIGEVQADGQFDVVWQTDKEVPGDAWSDVLPEDKGIEADWTDPIKGCGHFDTATKTCTTAPAP